jgi:hypothetical protein
MRTRGPAPVSPREITARARTMLPNRCVTARPPYALHTLLVNLGPQSASLVSCFLLLDRQARPVPVCATSRPRISWQLPLWGQDPTGTGSARAKCKNRRSCSPYFHSGRSTGARLPLGTVMSGARPLGVACSLEQSRAVPIQKLWFLPHERSETHPVQWERRNALCIETQAAYMMEVLRKGRKPCFRGQWFNNRNSVVGSA